MTLNGFLFILAKILIIELNINIKKLKDNIIKKIYSVAQF